MPPREHSRGICPMLMTDDISDSQIALLEIRKARALEFSNSRLFLLKATFRDPARNPRSRDPASAFPCASSGSLFGNSLYTRAYVAEACSDRVIRYYKSKPAGVPTRHEQEARLVVRTDSALRLETVLRIRTVPSRVSTSMSKHARFLRDLVR
jgi:hypothetical protein